MAGRTRMRWRADGFNRTFSAMVVPLGSLIGSNSYAKDHRQPVEEPSRAFSGDAAAHASFCRIRVERHQQGPRQFC